MKYIIKHLFYIILLINITSCKTYKLVPEKEDIPKLTEPFYRGDRKNNIKGFGIGLTIVKKVVESHHGELIIESDIYDIINFIVFIESSFAGIG